MNEPTTTTTTDNQTNNDEALAIQQQQTAEAIAKEIARRNKLFSKANKQQKRILIAKDVLNLLKQKRIIAIRTRFVRNYSLHEKQRDVKYKNQPDEPLQPLLLNPAIPPCECCALGSMMLSCTMFNNKENLSDYTLDFETLSDTVWESKRAASGHKKPKNGFADFFSEKQLALIEFVFEIRFSSFNGEYENSGVIANSLRLRNDYGITIDVHKKAITFAKKYSDQEERLKAIMRNIIRNKGIFKL